MIENRLTKVVNTNGVVTGTIDVPYENGNKQSYTAIQANSTALAGIKISLNGGTMNQGSGRITFQVTGNTRTAGNAKFEFTLFEQKYSFTDYIPKPGI